MLESHGEVIDGPLLREYRTLAARVAERREQVDRLRGLVDQLEDQASREEHVLNEMAGALGIDAQLRIEELNPTLRGARLREVALQILAAQEDRAKAIHYREWYDLVRERGYRVGGRDPVATFLAQITRAPGVERVGQRTGRYRLAVA